MTFLFSVTDHFSVALFCLPRTDKLSYSMQICRVKSNDWQPIWMLLSQPVSNCLIWFIYQLSRPSTLSFSPLFLLGGNRISWLVVLALRRNSNPEWFLVWVSHLTWSRALASSLARPSVFSLLPVVWSIRLEPRLHHLCPVLVLSPPILILSDTIY